MVANDNSDILGLLWETYIGNITLRTTAGENVAVVATGELNIVRRLACAASVKINDMLIKGDVVLGQAEPYSVYDYAILQIVAHETHYILDKNGSRIPQVIIPIPENISQYVQSLKNGIENCDCAYRVGAMESIQRAALYEKLAFERLARKCNDIMAVFRSAKEDWLQTFHITLFRAMAGGNNSEQYQKLASIVDYTTILRQRSSVAEVEALLLGGSGLLEDCYYDDYIIYLRKQFEYLRGKYDKILPMWAREWNISQKRPADGIIVRLVQLAALLTEREFLFDRALACRTRKDIQTLFHVMPSEYWSTHYRPDKRSNVTPKPLGTAAIDRLAINLIIPMMFAYGNYSRNESLKEAALAMYEQIPPEKNHKIDSWTGKDVPLKNSMDAQAILQLNNEYCNQTRCTECPIGKSFIKKYAGGFKIQ